MLDSGKFYEFFQPNMCSDTIHIIGCGAVGSAIAELLARTGLTDFVLYDFDTIEAHNIANQMYSETQIGEKKVDALEKIMHSINADIQIEKHGKYEGQPLYGYVFLSVDSIELRKKICEDNFGNNAIKAVFDARIRLTDAQGYAARWDNIVEKQNFINTMGFTDKEAAADTPTSACNMTLSVAPTVRIISCFTVSNFMNLFINKDNFKIMILIDAFNFSSTAF